MSSHPAFELAALLDLAATTVKVVQDRAKAKDYIDVVRLLAEGILLREALVAVFAIYGSTFNPLLSLKALAYFGDGDLPSLPKETREALERSVRDTPVESIHLLSPRGGIAPLSPRWKPLPSASSGGNCQPRPSRTAATFWRA